MRARPLREIGAQAIDSPDIEAALQFFRIPAERPLLALAVQQKAIVEPGKGVEQIEIPVERIPDEELHDGAAEESFGLIRPSYA